MFVIVIANLLLFESIAMTVGMMWFESALVLAALMLLEFVVMTTYVMWFESTNVVVALILDQSNP
jgi:hypothetical protein